MSICYVFEILNSNLCIEASNQGLYKPCFLFALMLSISDEIHFANIDNFNSKSEVEKKFLVFIVRYAYQVVSSQRRLDCYVLLVWSD